MSAWSMWRLVFGRAEHTKSAHMVGLPATIAKEEVSGYLQVVGDDLAGIGWRRQRAEQWRGLFDHKSALST